MEYTENNIETFNISDDLMKDVSFNVIEDELLAINRPTVQLYSN